MAGIAAHPRLAPGATGVNRLWMRRPIYTADYVEAAPVVAGLLRRIGRAEHDDASTSF